MSNLNSSAVGQIIATETTASEANVQPAQRPRRTTATIIVPTVEEDP